MCELKTKGFFLSFIPLHIKLYENIDNVEHLPWAVLDHMKRPWGS